MTHFAVLVLTETGEDAEIERLLAPYGEDGEWFADGSRWDWWVVGGRFTGLLTDYDPAADPANIEECTMCGGTGDRATWRDEPRGRQHPSGCNVCLGKGTHVKWPTDWQPHDGDRVAVSQVVPDAMTPLPCALVTPDGKWLEEGRVGWFGAVIPDEGGNPPKPEAAWRAVVRATLEQHPAAVAVVVDCHV